ncbi:hypothetical protein FZEAL_4557 [Fusarium zealandicum]|uniref:NACHT domain-containing protein n=1 Tax=Fusarium zealandicum TaxID=1053134 RepID=A0A8H4ULG6_9HYPO|nr:hypothetical protein FZEAL_4557 [Fusarium zealandicum]
MSSSQGDIVAVDNDVDVEVIGRDDVSNYNPGQILPEPPETIQRIRSWLQPTSYDIVGGEYRKHLVSHVAGTGDWVTSTAEYQQWLTSDQRGLLWIKGIPGSGKSVMAANLISELARSNPGCPVLFFFFRQIIEANHEPRALLRDWMEQVLDYSPPLQQQLVNTYLKVNRSIDSLSMEDMFKDLRMAFAGLPGKVFCVADALDEMDQGNDTFLEALGSLGQWRPEKVKVLVTSRPVPSVEAPLRRVPCLSLRLLEDLVDADISTYVQYTLSNSTIPPGEWQTIIDAVPGRANGLFLYGKLAMDAFLDPDADTNRVLSQLPADLNVLYTDLLQDHARRSGVSVKIQRLILQAVTHASRPLRLLELAEMIKVHSPDGAKRDLKTTKDLIRTACGPLLEILADETVSVIHHSFTEYLKGTTRSGNGSGYPILRMGPTHAQLALACLRYLQSGCLDDIKIKEGYDVDYSMANKRKSGIDIQLRLKHPFFEYSSKWHYHAKRSDAAGHDQTEVNAEIGRMLGHDRNFKAVLEVEYPASIRDLTQLHFAARAGLLSYTKHLLAQDDTDVHSNGAEKGSPTPLWFAASNGHADIVRELIAAGANPDQEDPIDGLKLLHTAALKNYHEVIKVLLEAGVYPLTGKAEESTGRRCGNAARTKGHTPIMIACTHGHLEAVEAFLPFIKDMQTVHRTLAWAAMKGRPEVVARILRHPNVDVDTKVGGNTPLFLACGSTDVETVAILIEAGADPNAECEDVDDEFLSLGRDLFPWMNVETSKWSCLHALCGLGRNQRYGGHKDPDTLKAMFELLVEAGADIDKRTPLGQTALHGAVTSSVFTRLLLDAGADANATDSSGAAPIHKAQKMDTIVLLLEQGRANIDLEDANGVTPLLARLDSSNKYPIFKLLEYGPNCNVVDHNGNGPLHIALKQWKHDSTVVKALLDGGAGPNQRNRDGLTPVLSMRGCCSGDVLDLLLDAGADINAKDRAGQTLLYPLLSLNSYSSSGRDCNQDLKDLINRGASTSVRDNKGRTLLHEAVKSHDCNPHQEPEVSRFDFLVSLGLDIHAVDYDGNSLLHEFASRDRSSGAKDISFWKHLLEIGLDVEQKNYAGRTPLHILCTANTGKEHFKRGDFMPVHFLIARTKKLDVADNEGMTPLHVAVTHGQRYVKLLVDAGSNPAAVTHKGLTPLHLAVVSRESNTIGILLDALRKLGGQISAVTNRSSPLEDSGNLPLVEPTVSPKAVSGVNAETFTVGAGGDTPLFYACRSGRPESVAVLLEAGADPRISKVWQACVEFQPHDHTDRLEEIVRLVIEHGADITELDGDEWCDSFIWKAYENNQDYTAACLKNARDQYNSDPDKDGYQGMIATFFERRQRATKDASVQIVQDLDDSDEPGHSCRNIFQHFMARREYYLVEELARRGVNFLPWAKENTASNLGDLVKDGFADLLEKIGTIVTKSALENGDHHAFGDDTQPGLWYAKRDRSQDQHSGCDPVPFIVDAVRRHLPNMGVVRLLVETFRVDMNESLYKMKAVDDGYKASPTETALHYVARGICWWHAHQALPYLLNAGADQSIRNEHGQTPLHVALGGTSGHAGAFSRETARTLIEAGADTNAVDAEGHSCLAFAQDDVDMIKLLKAHGATVTADAIFAAIDAGNVETLKEFICGGVDANMRCSKPDGIGHKNKGVLGCRGYRLAWIFADKLEKHEQYPLYHAGMLLSSHKSLKAGDVHELELGFQLVQVLLDHDADPFAKSLVQKDKFKSPSAPRATDRGMDTPSIEVPEGYEECTVLHVLLLQGKLVDNFLGLSSLDVNHRDAQGRTLLHAACQSGNGPDCVLGSHKKISDEIERVTVFQRLVFLGAELSAKDNFGRNALHYMICDNEGNSFDGFKDSLNYVLKEAPGLIHQADCDGKTPLHYALARVANRKSPRLAELLLSAGADPLAITENGDNALHILARRLDTKTLRDFFKALAGRGVDVNERNKQGETPLFAFCAHNKTAWRSDRWCDSDKDEDDAVEHAVPLLQKLGADVFARDVKGRGLLHVAASGAVGLFKALMEIGLDAMLEDEAQQTAIDVAAACKNKRVLELFEKKN